MNFHDLNGRELREHLADFTYCEYTGPRTSRSIRRMMNEVAGSEIGVTLVAKIGVMRCPHGSRVLSMHAQVPFLKSMFLPSLTPSHQAVCQGAEADHEHDPDEIVEAVTVVKHDRRHSTRFENAPDLIHCLLRIGTVV